MYGYGIYYKYECPVVYVVILLLSAPVKPYMHVLYILGVHNVCIKGKFSHWWLWIYIVQTEWAANSYITTHSSEVYKCQNLSWILIHIVMQVLRSMVQVTYRLLLLYNRNISSKFRYFSYPFNKTLPLRSRNKSVRGISDWMKTGRVINIEDLPIWPLS